MKLDYIEIGSATRKTDCYDGDTCDQLKPYWNSFFEGDMQDEDFAEPLKFHADIYPPGTIVTISVPVCKCCHTPKYMQDKEICKFDWNEWELNEYS